MQASPGRLTAGMIGIEKLSEGEGDTREARDSNTKFTPETNLLAGVKMLKNLGGTARGKTKCFYALQISKA